jgi:hypothetical protein
VVVSGHGVRLAGMTTSKGGSITQLQRKNSSYYSLRRKIQRASYGREEKIMSKKSDR